MKLHTKYRIAPLSVPAQGDVAWWAHVLEAVQDATVMPWDGVMTATGPIHEHEAGGATYRAVFEGTPGGAMVYVSMVLPD